MGKTSRAAITQIGAAQFDNETGEIFEEFEVNVDLEDAMRLGGEVDADTIGFWLEQPHRDFLMNPRSKLKWALQDFQKFLKRGREEWGHIWAHASFDAPILEHAFRSVPLELPFSYRKVADLRTFFLVAGYDQRRDNPRPHNALADVRYQIKGFIEAKRLIGRAKDVGA
jgi:hypothetical protein